MFETFVYSSEESDGRTDGQTPHDGTAALYIMWRGKKIAIFDEHLALSWKRYKIGPLWNTSKSAYAIYRMVPFPMI